MLSVHTHCSVKLGNRNHPRCPSLGGPSNKIYNSAQPKTMDPGVRSSKSNDYGKETLEKSTTPAAITNYARINKSLQQMFNWEHTETIPVDRLPPWCDTGVTVKLFPMSTKNAMKDKVAANRLFLTLTANEPDSHVSVYTHGSTHEGESTTKSTCTVFIPKLNIKQSWKKADKHL